MDKEKKDLKKVALDMKVKEMIEKSKSLNLIKDHTVAFEDYPVELEHHKGKMKAYMPCSRK